jgi:hypothetical protein
VPSCFIATRRLCACMCPRTTTFVRILQYMCVLTLIICASSRHYTFRQSCHHVAQVVCRHVSSYYLTCPYLYMCPHTNNMCVLTLIIYASSRHYTCRHAITLRRLCACMCPHTTSRVLIYICVRILLYICVLILVIYASSRHYKCRQSCYHVTQVVCLHVSSYYFTLILLDVSLYYVCVLTLIIYVSSYS